MPLDASVNGPPVGRESANSVGAQSSSFWSSPWVQLAMGVVCMAMVANLQYGWTIFVNPIDAKYHWGKAAIQVAFTLFIFLQTWLVPFEAYLADRYGPRPLVLFGAVLVAASWVIYSRASTLDMLSNAFEAVGDDFSRGPASTVGPRRSATAGRE